MATNHNLDYTQIPLSALKQSTIVTLSASLNQQKIIPADNGLPRDWRGLAQLIGLNGAETNQICGFQDRSAALLNHWGKHGSISLLQEYLGLIDRYDVLEDTEDAIVRDSLEYEERLKKIDSTDNHFSIEADKRILTTDDVIRLEKGLDPQIYDAYILYAEEDSEFAAQIIETMESKYNFKFCVRDRDLIGGVQFEHDAIAKLIAERCRRLVVVVSSNFLKSKANKFLVTFAQALGIDIRERKVIPILYERCEVPPELSYYFLLDYNRAGKLWNFWDKLRDSIQAPDVSHVRTPTVEDKLTKPRNDLWISRTHFEEPVAAKCGLSYGAATTGRKDPDPVWDRCDGPTPGKPRKGNLLSRTSNLIKNGFSKVKKGAAGSRQASSVDDKARKEARMATEAASLLDQLTNLVVNTDEVPFENFDNSSSFESDEKKTSSPSMSPTRREEDGDNRVDRAKKVKKKWYKKKAVETLLS